MKNDMLQLQYGINVFAAHVFNTYQPPASTAQYPDPQANKLREALSDYTGVAKDMIFCGSGSDELVELYIKIHWLRDPKLTVVMAPPMYFQYPVYARRLGAKVVALPHNRSLITPDYLRRHGVDPRHSILMFDNPSNPAGDIMTRQQFIDLLNAGYQVFEDEAYFEFYGHTLVDLLPTYPNQLVISRTLSKICAMAGSRVGYIMASPQLLDDFWQQKLHFNVNLEGQHRALFAISHMNEFLQAAGAMKRMKQQTAKQFLALGSYKVYPSLDLFFIFKHLHVDTALLHKKLQRDHHIATFLYDDFKGDQVIRCAVADKPAMQRLVAAAKALV